MCRVKGHVVFVFLLGGSIINDYIITCYNDVIAITNLFLQQVDPMVSSVQYYGRVCG